MSEAWDQSMGLSVRANDLRSEKMYMLSVNPPSRHTKWHLQKRRTERAVYWPCSNDIWLLAHLGDILYGTLGLALLACNQAVEDSDIGVRPRKSLTDGQKRQ